MAADTPTNRDAKITFVAKQFKEAMYQEGQSVQQVTCGCGLTMPLRFAFRCLYCGEFYCQPCAEDHFGKTRAQYNLEKKEHDLLQQNHSTNTKAQ